MKACAVTGLVAVVAAVSVLAASACGGSASESPPPAAPTSSEPAAAAEPAAGAASAPAGSGAATDADAPPADLGAGDSRTTDSIATLVKTHRKEARDCYEKALKQTPGLKGDVVIRFTLKPSGEVKHAELNEERSTIRQAAVSSCVIDVIRAIAFPKSSKGLETTVNYPFNFNP